MNVASIYVLVAPTSFFDVTTIFFTVHALSKECLDASSH